MMTFVRLLVFLLLLTRLPKAAARGALSGPTASAPTQTLNSEFQVDPPPLAHAQPSSAGRSLINWDRFRFMEYVFRGPLSLFLQDPDAIRLVSKGMSWAFWVAFLLSAFGTVGFDTKPILSLLSVSLVTVGFAAKDVLTSLFAGIMLVAQKPFKRGDLISLLGYKGVVVAVDVKYVRLRTGKSDTLLPVGLVVNAPITVEKAEK